MNACSIVFDNVRRVFIVVLHQIGNFKGTGVGFQFEISEGYAARLYDEFDKDIFVLGRIFDVVVTDVVVIDPLILFIDFLVVKFFYVLELVTVTPTINFDREA